MSFYSAMAETALGGLQREIETALSDADDQDRGGGGHIEPQVEDHKD